MLIHLNQSNAPGGPDIGGQSLQIGLPVFDVVQHIVEEDQIDRVDREIRIVELAENRFQIFDIFLLGALGGIAVVWRALYEQRDGPEKK